MAQHDLRRNPPILSRFLSRETAHDRAVGFALAGLAESAFHERGHEPVRPDFSRATKAAVESASRRRHAEMHPRGRKTQRPRRCRTRYVSPHVLRDARQLELRRLFQEGSDRVGVGTGDRALETSAATALRDRLQTGAGRAERVRSGSARSLGAALREGGARSRGSHRQRQQKGQFLDDGRYRSVRPVLRAAHRSHAGGRHEGIARERRRSALHRDLESRFSSSSTRMRTAPSRRCRSGTSIPEWVSSESPR